MWYLFKRLTAVFGAPFYRFEHIVTFSSGKVIAKLSTGISKFVAKRMSEAEANEIVRLLKEAKQSRMSRVQALARARQAKALKRAQLRGTIAEDL
jgi:hypothetical protein